MHNVYLQYACTTIMKIIGVTIHIIYPHGYIYYALEHGLYRVYILVYICICNRQWIMYTVICIIAIYINNACQIAHSHYGQLYSCTTPPFDVIVHAPSGTPTHAVCRPCPCALHSLRMEEEKAVLAVHLHRV